MQTYHALLCSEYFVFPSRCRSCWVDPIPSWPTSGTPAGESCNLNSGDAIDSSHLKMSFHSMDPALQRPHCPFPECRCPSREVPKYRSIEARRANQIWLTKCTPTRTRMQRRPSRFSMSCPILPHISPLRCPPLLTSPRGIAHLLASAHSSPGSTSPPSSSRESCPSSTTIYSHETP